MPLTYNNKHLFTSFIANAFVGFTALAMTLITVGIIYFLLNEKRSDMKNLIILSGMNTDIYWLSNFV